MRKALLSVLGLAALALMMAVCTPVKQVEAQFAGQSAFQVPFTIAPHATNLFLPACTTNQPTAAVPCIPNRNQLGHTITWQWTQDLGTVNDFIFEGSNDNSNWAALAAGNSGGSNTNQAGISYANGYYTYMRLSIDNTTSTLTGVYTGYAQPVPVNPVSLTRRFIDIFTSSYVGRFGTPYITEGFQCFNPNSNVSSGTAVFTGAGLNDLTKSGTYACAGGRKYRVQVDATGTPDKFKWSNDGGATFQATLVSMTGAAQLLECGLSVTFGATTGHTLNNRWDFNTTDGTAYLKLYGGAGLDPFYEIGIAPGTTFNYSGPAIINPQFRTDLLAGATSTPGITANQLGSPLVCSFQVNPFGPFYPFTSGGF